MRPVRSIVGMMLAACLVLGGASLHARKPSDTGVLNFDWGTTRLTTDFMVH
jgi:hypothetical protein